MWVFSRSSFLSIIADDDDPDMLIVRSRFRTDLHALWPRATVHKTPWRDYAYRARIPRAEVAAALSREVTQLSYTNYKAEVHAVNPRRSKFYAWIWCIMADAGDELDGPRISPK